MYPGSGASAARCRGSAPPSSSRTEHPSRLDEKVEWSDRVRLQDRANLRRVAPERDRMESGREEVRMRARRHVDDRVCPALLLDAGPRTLLARAVLAVCRLDRALLRVENDGDDLPVAFVRLPGEPARRVLQAPEVMVVEVPVLEHDRARADFVTPVDDTRSTGRGDVACDRGETPGRRAATVVEPPALAVDGQACPRRRHGVIQPIASQPLQVGIADEVLDGRRRERLGPVEHRDRLVEGEQVDRRELIVGTRRRNERDSGGGRQPEPRTGKFEASSWFLLCKRGDGILGFRPNCCLTRVYPDDGMAERLRL